MIENDDEDDDDIIDEEVESDVATRPNEAADPDAIVKSKFPKEIQEKYELLSYRNAAVILSETRKKEFGDILAALSSFEISEDMIRKAGGNESDIPKIFSDSLRPKGGTRQLSVQI